MTIDLFNPHFAVSTIMDGTDLSLTHFVACLSGAILATCIMNMRSYADTLRSTCWLAKALRRLSLAGIALTMLWSLAYSMTKDWEPWAPYVFLLLAVDISLLSQLIVAVKERQETALAGT